MAEVNSNAAEKLWDQYKRDSSLENKNELVMHYLYLVKSIVYRLMPTYEGYSNFDDLLSCGVLGLIDAINKFDMSRDIRFESYAKLRIRGEIIDNMRRQDWAPSSLRRKIQSVSNAYASLEKELLRAPTDFEVADHLGMEEKELQKLLDKTHTFNVLHFEELVSSEMSIAAVVPDTSETPEERLESKEMKRMLGDMIESLPEKERLVITLYYYEELTLKEIAHILGVSESRASQIHSKAMLKFRSKLQNVLNQ